MTHKAIDLKVLCAAKSMCSDEDIMMHLSAPGKFQNLHSMVAGKF